MLAEKLLLHLLITISPVLIHSVLLENKRTKYEPVLCGFIAGIASVLCMIFTYKNYGLYWDLRYVPIILSFLYCGPLSGGITVLLALLARSMMDGGNLLFAFIICAVSITAPLLVIKKFQNYSPRKRIQTAIITGIWPLIVSFLGLFVNSGFQGSLHRLSLGYDIFLLAFIHVLSIGLSSKLIENFCEKKRMTAEIERAKKLNTLGELAASIAHEVRNPLTVVKGFLQLMKQEEHGKNYEYLSLVLSELGHAETIISDYLNFAKPKLDKIEKFQINDVLSEIMLLLDPLAMKNGVQFESELIGSIYLTTDRNQLKQALVNFIKNAIEATEQGGKVSIRLIQENNLGIIYISDTGKGMTEEQLTRIGTLFYTTKEKGTGLGTSVSMRIIETMKGKVTFMSEPGIGTEVKMILPIS
ncbi:ATP-binding protein [Neobacillus sp. PS3-40]|uniref:ATP-binding protein n=1 Tax=Neobacillus sp. PS3-40 TaxID=3070679 RepID=UPI0027DEBE4E|nr:ATP-binding protein [Neobacillus sp. PS3-40]WML42912.1 ATP-binding protein [Neobacillus sp. PS3-40]